MSTRMNPDLDMQVRTTFGATEPEPKRPDEFIPISPRTVIVLMVAFKHDLGLCRTEINNITRRLWGYRFKASLHSKKQCAWVVQTELTALALFDRVRPKLADVGAVENAWTFTPGADVASLLPLDAFQDQVATAWREVRRFNARFGKQRLPRSIFEKVTPMEGGKGEISLPILDHHPLAVSPRGRA